MAMPDITVVGAGAFGLSCAWACLQRGARVRVIEKRRVGAGSSGGVVGALAPHVPENWNEKKAFQLESLLMAEAFWAEVDATSGLTSGYARLGRLQPVLDDRALDLAYARAEGAKALWQGRAIWEVVESSGDWVPPSPTGKLIRDTLSARINPATACASLAAAIRTECGVIDEGVTEVPSGPVIHATGYEGLLSLSEHFDKPLGNGVKGQAALLNFDARDEPQLFADALHIVPHADGTVAVGSTSERDFDHPDETDAQLDDILARVHAAFPILANAPVLSRWAGVRPRAKSRAPMLGAWPDRPGHFIANGGFKIGFGMAPKVAEVMADLVLEGRDAIPEGFRVEANF